jgi:hypothetical protein
MKTWQHSMSVTLIALLFVFCLRQSIRAEVASGATPFTAPGPAHSLDRSHFKVIRIIRDFGTNDCWALERELNRPAVPASLRPVSCDSLLSIPQFDRLSAVPGRSSIPAIHVGDKLLLTEHTSVADAQLEAIALSAGDVGDAISVRLKIGGSRLRAIATGKGRANIAGQTWETRP